MPQSLPSFAAAFRQAEAFLPEALIPPASVEQCRRVARLLPAFAIDFFGFEACHSGLLVGIRWFLLSFVKSMVLVA